MLNVRGAAFADSSQVSFITDTVMNNDQGILSLLDGSKWKVGGTPPLLLAQDVIIVLTSERQGFLYDHGMRWPVTLIDGFVNSKRGTLTSVIDATDDGDVITLANGRRLGVPSYDTYDTGYWFPPYEVILESSELYLWNLEERKRIWVEP